MPAYDPARSARGRYGALVSWSRTLDRSARTRPARSASPSSISYWLDRLGPEFADASDSARLNAAEAARRAYFAKLSARAVAARRAAA